MMLAARIVVLLSALAAQQTTAFDPLKTVARDLAALRMRSTARHIMRPKTPDGRGQCEVIQRSIQAARSNGTFVVDAFADAARSTSIDPDTGPQGGLLGERMPQGRCCAREVMIFATGFVTYPHHRHHHHHHHHNRYRHHHHRRHRRRHHHHHNRHVDQVYFTRPISEV